MILKSGFKTKERRPIKGVFLSITESIVHRI